MLKSSRLHKLRLRGRKKYACHTALELKAAILKFHFSYPIPIMYNPDIKYIFSYPCSAIAEAMEAMMRLLKYQKPI